MNPVLLIVHPSNTIRILYGWARICLCITLAKISLHPYTAFVTSLFIVTVYCLFLLFTVTVYCLL